MILIKRIFLAFIFLSSLACADDRTVEMRAADELIHCMAAFNWMRMNTEGEKKADVEKWLHSFYGAAKDLTNDAYVVEHFKLEGMEFQERTERELFTLREWLPGELTRCYKMDFSPEVIARLQVLIESVSKGKQRPK